MDNVTVTIGLDQGCQIGHFVTNFEKFGHFFTALALTKRLWPFFWPFFQLVIVELSFH